MKISLTASDNTLPKEIVPVRLTEGEDTRLCEKASWRLELAVGVGKREEMTLRKLRVAARKLITAAKEHKLPRIAVFLDEFLFPNLMAASGASTEGNQMSTNLERSHKIGVNGKSTVQGSEIKGGEMKEDEKEKEMVLELVVENFELADYEFNVHKTPPRGGFKQVTEVVIVGDDSLAFKKALRRAQTVAKEVNACRDLANTPGSVMTPKYLAEKAREAAAGLPIFVEVLGRREMEREGMGAVLGVAKGSSEEPQFIVLEYRGGEKDEPPIVLCGKGVTFDSGGLNLKPTDSIYEMHMDMSGAAAVIHATVLAARLKLKKNVIAIAPAVENMPSGSSYRPGDILKSLSGKTIEVLNTDAEGRIILADALTYAERYKPRLVVDVATLTGASLIALGQVASAIMTRDENLANKIRQWGEESGEYVWPLPLWDEYDYIVKGEFGDIPNIPAEGNTRHAGVIGGGMFLYQFAKNHPAWVHIDMAPRMTSAKGDHLAKGAAGSPVRLLLKIVEEF
ncbi:MAG: leucyl aminopeptidase [bacterium]|nr:leucyl aminopeptidase [bacterium]MDZ4284732.1 leucyl aminopeptidase [Patescibacteria group bacterium]